ncbi:MAG: ribosomal protein S18-alanine N-acetyltransferase [Clostridia bacterium]
MEQIIEFNDYHINQCEELEQKLFSVPWSVNQIKESLSNDFCTFLAYDIDNILAGYIGVYFILDEAQILNIGVSPNFQRKGIASKLLVKLEEIAKEKKINYIILEVRSSNEKAISLYSKFGYNIIDIRKNYYKKPEEDAFIFKKTL